MTPPPPNPNATPNATPNTNTNTNPNPRTNPRHPAASIPSLTATVRQRRRQRQQTPPPDPGRLLQSREWVAANLPQVLARLCPEQFRRQLRIDSRDPRPLHQRAEPFQRRDFRALDPAWQHLAGRCWSSSPLRSPPAAASDPVAAPIAASASTSTPPVRRFWIERPRGHSKTTDTAAMLLWTLLASRHAVRGVVAAADKD